MVAGRGSQSAPASLCPTSASRRIRRLFCLKPGFLTKPGFFGLLGVMVVAMTPLGLVQRLARTGIPAALGVME